MGPVAKCSRTDPSCSGTLSPLFDKETGDIKSYYCDACGTIYKRIEIKEGVPMGTEYQGKLDQQDSLREAQALNQRKIDNYEAKFVQIQELIVGDSSDLAQLIQLVLNETAEQTVAGVPAPMVDEPA